MNLDSNYARRMCGLVDDFRRKDAHQKKITMTEKCLVQLLEDIEQRAKKGEILMDYSMPVELRDENEYAEYLAKRLRYDFGFDACLRPDMRSVVQICWKPEEKYNVER